MLCLSCANISKHQLSGSESVAAFSRLIAGLISLIFEVADAAIDPDISQQLVALFNLIQGKEFAGQERAVGALAFGSGTVSEAQQQRLSHLVDGQERNFRVFLEFAEVSVVNKWHELQSCDKYYQQRMWARSWMRTSVAPGLNAVPNVSMVCGHCNVMLSRRFTDDVLP